MGCIMTELRTSPTFKVAQALLVHGVGVGGVAVWDDARGRIQSPQLDIWEYDKFIADYDARAKANPATTRPRGQPSAQWEWDAIRDPFAPGPR